MMYVAVRAGNKVVGFLSVHSYAPDAYGQESLDTLQGLADHFGGALERMGAEETQRRSEQRFHLVTRATNDLVWDWNLETGQVWWNEAFQTMFGYKPEDFPNASEAFEHIVSLPIYPGMIEANVRDVIVAVRQIVQEYRR